MIGASIQAMPTSERDAVESTQQDKTIRGKIVDELGEPLIGVSVYVKGTSIGSITNVDGEFSFSIPAGVKTLEASYVGYTTQTITVGNNVNFNIQMKPDNLALEEVVVIGYGTVKKRDLTGAVSSVKNEDIVMRPGPNPMEALQGKVAGLDITRESGQAGAGVKMQLRGNRSFTADGNPLFLIDGLPGDYETLNPNDIESIEVLKDASSTAIYGAAGSNGVVIITTKAGKAGKMSVDFNAYVGYNGWSKIPKMHTGDSYAKIVREAHSYVWDESSRQWTTTGALWQSAADDERVFGTQRYERHMAGAYVDWADLYMRKNAATQNYSLSVSGGNDRTKGYISFNYTDENGQYKGDQYELFSTSMRIDHEVRKWLSIGSSLQGSYVMQDKAQAKLENALTSDPLEKPYNDDGTINPNLGNNVYNLLLNYQPGVYENSVNNFKVFVNPYIEIKPIKGLSILSRAGIWMNYSNSYKFDGIGSVNYTYGGEIAKAQINQNRSYGYQWDNVLTYNFKLQDVHDFTLTAVSTWKYDQQSKTTMDQTNISSNNFKWHNMQGDASTTAKSSYLMSKTLGFIGRINYSYLGKYIFSASIRRDGASALYKDNRWDNFPAASAAWRISDESFMESTKNWLDNLKLRVGWGVTGSASIKPYSSFSNLEQMNTSLGGVGMSSYRYSEFLTNSKLGWEKSYNTNIGLDFGLFNNRIDVSMDYYVTRTDGVIWSVSLPIIYGSYKWGNNFYKTNMNLAETENRGFEITANTRNIMTKDFEWTSALTFSTNKEKIVKLTGGANDNIENIDPETGNNTGYTLTIGKALNSYYNYKIDGVWQLDEEKDAAVFGRRPGDLKVNVPGMKRKSEGVWEKTLADGTTKEYTASSKYAYSANDYQTLGHNSPDWTLGFQNGIKYKDFDLSVYAFFRWGQMINYCMPGWYQPNALTSTAAPPRTFPSHFNYWTPTNPSNEFPVLDYTTSASTMTGFSGMNYVNGSFFKLKNITLGYTLPKKLSKKLSIDKLRVYGTVTNLLVLAKDGVLKNYDPEMNGELEYPLTKQLVFGLNVTF
ncbi:TonB-dependent receptor [Bacteroides sp. 214]|uniref:SusC/RagA family TonB-linked outer membrane protein n=1 Tax=Bacteroides sp. 214 TaxID=2302935 RepID=UPI0013CFB9E9|nr:TonB-dependent receptor [Bacteroides sp. 214]